MKHAAPAEDTSRGTGQQESASAVVAIQDEGPVRWITLNRPGRRNALNQVMIRALRDAIGQAAADRGVRVIGLRGAGKDFCAGADLLELRLGADPVESLEEAQALGDLFCEIRVAPKPVVAAVRGRALAGGCGLATACDIVLASGESLFGYPEVKLGFVPAMVMAMLRRATGEKRAFDLVTSGEPVTALRAAELGLVTRVLPSDGFARGASEFAAALAARSASALALTKRLFHATDTTGFEDAIRAGAHVNALARATEDCQEGIRKFLTRKASTDTESG
ncbi:MAG: enoyl-CoA hydratase/isomerase family protein [Gemmatimonadetes bacterium]|nr:enoyl-CoA hydratase/isomerase family protein [Gemmatimonadota bacterium]